MDQAIGHAVHRHRPGTPAIDGPDMPQLPVRTKLGHRGQPPAVGFRHDHDAPTEYGDAQLVCSGRGLGAPVIMAGPSTLARGAAAGR